VDHYYVADQRGYHLVFSVVLGQVDKECVWAAAALSAAFNRALDHFFTFLIWYSFKHWVHW